MPPGIVKQPQHFGPPRKVGYAPGPIYNSPSQFSSPASGFPGPIAGPVYHSKPPGPIIDSPPYKFDTHGEHILSNEEFHALGLDRDQHVKTSINDGITGSGSNSVNIHHHYHHIDGAAQHDNAKAPAVIVNNPIPVPVPAAAGLVTGEYSTNQGVLAGNGGFNTNGVGFNSLSSNYQSGFKPQSGFNGINPSGQYGGNAKPIFESVGNYDGSGPGASGFGATGFGNVNSLGGGGSFHSSNPDYYKKALKGGSGINSLNSYGGSNYGGIYNGAGSNYESARQDNFDCVCVPYDQCPARDILGRKGDLILPLDPRNLGSEIEAEDSNSTSNSTVTRVPKEVNDDDASAAAAEDDENVEIETTKQNVKKVSKREVAAQKSDELQKADGEAVSIQYFSNQCLICTKSFHFIIFFKCMELTQSSMSDWKKAFVAFILLFSFKRVVFICFKAFMCPYGIQKT